MIGLCTLAAGLVVGPGAHLHLRKVELARKAELHNVERNVELRMCDAEAPAPAGRSPSVLTEMREKFKVRRAPQPIALCVRRSAPKLMCLTSGRDRTRWAASSSTSSRRR